MNVLAVLTLMFGLHAAELPASPNRLVATPHAVAWDYSNHMDFIHGVAGDSNLVFTVYTFSGKVVAMDRFSGRIVGEAAIPNPFLPFSLRIPRPGTIMLLDVGALPGFPVSVPRLHEYTYSYKGGRFTMTLKRSLHIQNTDPAPGFVSDLEYVPSLGGYLLADQVLGGVWFVRESDLSVTAAIAPQSPAFTDALPAFAGTLWPTVQTWDFYNSGSDKAIPYGLLGNFAAGINYIAANDTHLYWPSAIQGAIYRIPLSVFKDNRQPWERAQSAELISPLPAGEGPMIFTGLSFNKYSRNDDSLYAADGMHHRILRIDIHTGARQVIVEDPLLFDGPVATAFLPQHGGVSTMVVVSDEEHRVAGIANEHITQDMLAPPWIVAKVIVRK